MTVGLVEVEGGGGKSLPCLVMSLWRSRHSGCHATLDGHLEA